ncbi:hypothetical protein TRIUR3_09054 [Triticum urartu]|uniref:Uncharacterized protein n=1 Tax=Triticum urartu TaxID=4572 RepID=M7ZPR4_TRIUA|nr:hypothetical protein TRIUR3_09054 [Triticum urartu]
MTDPVRLPDGIVLNLNLGHTSLLCEFGSAVINEKKSYNTETTGNLPIEALQGKSAQGSRYWELHDCPSNVEGMNPPGFSSRHPVWEGFAVPVKKEGGKLSFFCVACKKLLSGNAAVATKHMLCTKGCAISEEGKMDLKTRIREFDNRRNDLKRKCKEPKEGVVQGYSVGALKLLYRYNVLFLCNRNCSSYSYTVSFNVLLLTIRLICVHGYGSSYCKAGRYFPACTDRWAESDDDRISSFDPLSHSFLTAIPQVTAHRFKATVEAMFSIVHHVPRLKLLQCALQPEMKEVKQENNPIRIRFEPWILFPVVGPQMITSTRYPT